jgi:spore maturation protein CgeB
MAKRVNRIRMKSIEFLRRKLDHYLEGDRELETSEAWIADELEFIHFPPKSDEEYRPLRIFYIADRYSQGVRSRGFSHLEYNLLDTLVNMGHYILRLEYPRDKESIRKVNSIMRDVVARYNPDLMLTVLIRDQLECEIIREISTQTDTLTLNYFCDDDWKFNDFSRHWAPAFNWVLTNAKSALPKYEQMGYKNVIYIPWGYNHSLYKKLKLPRIFDVTFVGQPHGSRREVVSELRKHDINVQAWGTGWENGRLSQLEMIKVFNQSKINLNLSETSPVRGLNEVKARDVEVPGCGGFLITGAPIEEISEYYEVGEEVVHYESIPDLIHKIRYYLTHDDEREVIARAGYNKARTRHTYQDRFAEIFSKMGLL